MATPRTESAPWSAPADDGGDPITAAMLRVQHAIDSRHGSVAMLVSEPEQDLDVPPSGADPLGPPRVILQPPDLLASPPAGPRAIADVIADSARTVLALSALPSDKLDALAREIGANVAQVLAVGDRIERFIATAREFAPATYASAQLFTDGGAYVSLHVDSDEDLHALAAELSCDAPERCTTGTSDFLRSVRGSSDDRVRVSIIGPMRPLPATAAEQALSAERAA